MKYSLYIYSVKQIKILEMSISKAELERRKSKRLFLNTQLRRRLIQFEDRYLEAVLNWEESNLEASSCPQLKGKTYQELYPQVRSEFPKINESAIGSRVVKILGARKTREAKTIFRHKVLQSASESYKLKFDSLVSKISNSELVLNKMNIQTDTVGVQKGEISILISDGKVEFHARSIWVNGVLVVPHYRFISTERLIQPKK